MYIEEFGTPELFTEMVTPEFKEAVGDGSSNLEALDNKAHALKKVKEWEHVASQGVKKMFALMSEQKNPVGICTGHDPVISLSARYFGKKDARSIAPLEHIVFHKFDSGEITVE